MYDKTKAAVLSTISAASDSRLQFEPNPLDPLDLDLIPAPNSVFDHS